MSNDIVNKKQLKHNSFIIALFLMQYTLFIPVMYVVNSTLVAGVVSFFVVCDFLLTNRKLVFANLYIWYFSILLLFLVKLLVGAVSAKAIGLIIAFTLPGICIFSNPFDFETCLNYLIKMARLGFFLVFSIPFILRSSYNYMRFGYGMLPVVIMAYISFFYYKTEKKALRILDLIIMIVGLVEMVVYGARGASFSFILFLFLDRFFFNRKKLFINAVIIFLIVIVWYNIIPILDFAEMMADKIGIYSYAITKFKMQIRGGFDYASSGRDVLYLEAIKSIKESILFGGVISFDESGGDFVHNLFLQVGKDFGIIGFTILVVFLLRSLIFIGSHNRNRQGRLLIMVLFSISVGRLMFSSTIWRRPEFWMLVGITLSMKKNEVYCEVTGNNSGVTNSVND